jgi:uncharacterized protein
MYRPKTIYTAIALAAICENMKGKKDDLPPLGTIPSELLNSRQGCFVSLHKTDGALRGCIGTIDPYERNLVEEISRNAVSAAFNDNRFNPLTEVELDDVELSVDVLTVPEQINSLDDLDPQIFGVIVADNSYHRAVLLPSIPGIDTVDKQIEIVKRKAGLSSASNNKLTFYRFTSNRYH